MGKYMKIKHSAFRIGRFLAQTQLIKDFNLAIGGGLGWMKLLKMGQGKLYISFNNSCTISFLVKILLVKWK